MKLILRLKILLSFHKRGAKSLALPDMSCEKKKIFFFLAADYGNLGDVAITYAQTKYLQEHYPDAEVVEIPISTTLSGIKAVKQIIQPDDIVTIVGGGNMGDRYDDIEFLRQRVVSAFKHNRIVSFPQTIEFSNTCEGHFLLWIAKNVYHSHHNLTLFAREKVSYDKMRRLFPDATVEFVPDIVMTLDKQKPAFPREGVTLCLRNDGEQKFQVKEQLKALLSSRGMDCREYDTHIGRGNLSVGERHEELDKIWTAFKQSEYIVTDRLHGMIFAFITGTPAIVLPNSNHKIASAFEWIKDCGYIRFIQDLSELETALDGMTHTENHFDDVHEQIMNAMNEKFVK